MAAKPPAPRGPVGYGTPPVETRFQAGRSGNPKGRPKGAKNMTTIMNEELGQLVTATENGKRRRLTTGRAIAKRLINQAVGGNVRAVEILLKYASGESADKSAETVGIPNMNEQDEALLNRHLARMNAARSGRKDGDNE
jgi:uncharacterized protein DUF5681